MPLYTFYPTRDDGLSSTFESHEMDSDREASLYAPMVLQTYESASAVVVFCDNRRVFTHARFGAVSGDSALSA